MSIKIYVKYVKNNRDFHTTKLNLPTSALDVTIQAEVVREMKKLREQYQAAIILVTHNMGVASYISDKIGVMCQGKLVEFGKRDDVIFHPKHEYTRSLLAAVPRLEGKRFAK